MSEVVSSVVLLVNGEINYRGDIQSELLESIVEMLKMNTYGEQKDGDE